MNNYQGGSDEYYLKIAMELAKKGESLCYPNPIVGSIIVYEGKHSFELDLKEHGVASGDFIVDKLIVGYGYHKKFGDSHAEPNAIENAEKFYQANKDKLGVDSLGEFFNNCDIYVSLEPCCHEGKTAPCSKLIIDKKFKRLIYAMNDPNPKVDGKGLEEIKKTGIEIKGPADLNFNLAREALYLNRKFYQWITHKKPWITIKIASKSNGSMITEPNEDRWITNKESRKEVHRMRSANQVLITGINTVLEDDPELNVRHSAKELSLDSISQPQRIILKSEKDFTDSQRKELKIFKESKDIKKAIEYKIRKTPEQAGNFDFENLEAFLNSQVENNTGSIMIEAGPSLSDAFLKTGLVNEIVHFQPIEDLNKDIEKIKSFYTEKGLEIKEENIQAIKIETDADRGGGDICLKILL